MIAPLLILLAIGGLMHAAHTFFPDSGASDAVSGTTLAFGYLLLSAFFAGNFFARMRLPRLTGYMVAGLVAGPAVLKLVNADMLDALGPVKGVAVCLIALTAGGELNYQRMRPLLKTIRSVTLWSVVLTASACAITLYFLRQWLPFLDGLDQRQTLAACAVLGVAISAMSPAVTMALFSELRADGPLTRTILGVVVLADLVVIVLFAVSSSVAQSVLGGTSSAAQVALHLSWELFGSLGVGVLFGVILSVFLRKVHTSRSLFVLLLCVVMSEVCGRMSLDPLLIALATGMFIENVTEHEASQLIHDIEGASMPVYVVFFALAGAMLELDLLLAVTIPAAAVIAARTLAMFLGARIGAARTQDNPLVTRWLFVGLLPQAGLALAIALLLPRVFPSFGDAAAGLVVGVVGVTQLVTPIFLRWGLISAGEAHQEPPISQADIPPSSSELSIR